MNDFIFLAVFLILVAVMTILAINSLLIVNKVNLKNQDRPVTHKDLDKPSDEGEVIVYSRKDLRSEYLKYRNAGHSVKEATRLAKKSSSEVTKRVYEENEL